MWYLHRRGTVIGTRRIASDEVYRAPLADTAVPHLLFLGLALAQGPRLEGWGFRTFLLLRRFSDIAVIEDIGLPLINRGGGRLPVQENNRKDWAQFLRERTEQRRSEYRSGRNHGGILDIDEYAPFAHLCHRAATAMGYMAPAVAYQPMVPDGEGAHFLLPRFEIAVDMGGDDHTCCVQDMHDLAAWMASGGMELDRAHSQDAFDPGHDGGLPILVPDVVVAAHETATFARTVLGQEVTDSLRELVAELRRR
jgi:hypothetical protein